MLCPGQSSCTFDKVVNEVVVRVLPAKMDVTGHCENLEDPVLNAKLRHIECPTTEIIHNDLALAPLLIEGIRNSGSGGLVDAEDLQTHNDAGVLGNMVLGLLKPSCPHICCPVLTHAPTPSLTCAFMSLPHTPTLLP